MSRDDFKKELESVDILDVNQYKSKKLKQRIKEFTLKNDLQKFNLIVEKLRT